MFLSLIAVCHQLEFPSFYFVYFFASMYFHAESSPIRFLWQYIFNLTEPDPKFCSDRYQLWNNSHMNLRNSSPGSTVISREYTCMTVESLHQFSVLSKRVIVLVNWFTLHGPATEVDSQKTKKKLISKRWQDYDDTTYSGCYHKLISLAHRQLCLP